MIDPVDPAIVVRLLEPADIGTTSALLTAALDDDPAYAFLFPRRQDRRRGLRILHAQPAHPLAVPLYARRRIGSAVVATVTMRPPGGVSISMNSR